MTHYRFLIARGDGQQWLAGNGLVDIDAPDAADFKLTSYAPAPDWARDGVVYQIFRDRFACSAAADQRPTPPWAVPAGWTDTVIFEGSDPRTSLHVQARPDVASPRPARVARPPKGTHLADGGGVRIPRSGRISGSH